MDLKSGYWQISVDEDDREKTAFITPDGLFEFKVTPFGVCNAPATFERMMDGLLKGLRWTICLCYLNDIVVFADNFSDHLARIEAVLNCFKKVGLRLNPSKCSFGANKIKILGHQVDQNGIRPDEEKIKAITEFPAPNNLQQSEILQKKLLQEDDDVTLDKVFAVAISFELAEINTRELQDKLVAKISPVN
ncbi:K02A2.6-like [Cordylochernes scorpioides]|uniref:K02A2.6-like n=1 Tax=Cordylochernes scorpioides TaxID=51811 RepID=A0ABY6KH03_9ARAC|nr:K02A2.6-like [Cordylochernes scorpioides]